MPPALDPDRLATAAKRFTAFFNELGRAYVEREDVLAQVALALLAREHVLMTGPPGTAKSQLATAVLGRIVDETTGLPSVYARQFTESTVQTDLVGPINFKTLMDTGRTEHFTDEGMLGAVHAFIDEVFDGRDMLLRSALNVLNERELKQGTRTTRGQIECALMTTNRYLAEVLEGSRETLLAFVDRVGFLNFVPRGFATPANLGLVLRRQVSGVDTLRLETHLTIQDLDVLQALTESVEVSAGICDGLVQLLGLLETEMVAAAKADANFVATRYLSVRTAVRAGRILRAICVYDRLFRAPNRSLRAEQGDFLGLRLHLLLAGPPPDAIEALLARESDPRERRQLGIVRTEREIFERCLEKLDPIASAPPPPTVDVLHVKTQLTEAMDEGNASDVVRLASDLEQLARSGNPAAQDAERAFRDAVEQLAARAMRLGLTAGAVDDVTIEKSVDEMVSVADAVERGPQGSRAFARWLRGRAVTLVEESSLLAPMEGSLQLQQGSGTTPATFEALTSFARRPLERTEKLAQLRDRLLALGADVDDAEASRQRWASAVRRAEDDAVLAWDAALRQHVLQVFAAMNQVDLAGVLQRIESTLVRIREARRRFTQLLGAPSTLLTRVVAPRLGPIVKAALARIEIQDRVAMVAQIRALLQEIAKAGLSSVLPPEQLLGWVAEALIRNDGAHPLPSATSFSAVTYRRLRAEQHRTSLVFTLIEIAMHALPKMAARLASPAEAPRAMQAILAQIDPRTAQSVGDLDVARVTRLLHQLEQGWHTARGEGVIATLNPSQATEILSRATSSGLVELMQHDRVLLHLSLEARLLADALPLHRDAANEMRERVQRLDAEISEVLAAATRVEADAAWEDSLSRAT